MFRNRSAQLLSFFGASPRRTWWQAHRRRMKTRSSTFRACAKFRISCRAVAERVGLCNGVWRCSCLNSGLTIGISSMDFFAKGRSPVLDREIDLWPENHAFFLARGCPQHSWEHQRCAKDFCLLVMSSYHIFWVTPKSGIQQHCFCRTLC